MISLHLPLRRVQKYLYGFSFSKKINWGIYLMLRFMFSKNILMLHYCFAGKTLYMFAMICYIVVYLFLHKMPFFSASLHG